MLKATFFRKKNNCRHGFTMGEALTALVLLSVLFALVIPNVVHLSKKLNQTELDAKAETIYIAAQAQLTHLRTSGNESVYEGGENALWGNPMDAAATLEDGEEIVRTLYYTYKGETLGDALMSEGAVEENLRDHAWIIEYDKGNGTVYAVFYSEKRDIVSEYRGNWGKYDGLREYEARLDDGAVVGYYGGDISSTTSATSQLKPTINPRNGEILSVYMQCTAPKSSDELEFTLTIRDEYGHKYKQVYTKATSPQVHQAGRSFYLDLVLDDLASPATRFNALFGSASGLPESERLVPGSRLELTLTVSGKSGLIEKSAPVRAFTNGLFGDESDCTAQILCGRHLQNLDVSSGVTDAITAARQQQNVDFVTQEVESWRACYGDTYFNGLNGAQSDQPRFKPIRNDYLTEYDGGSLRIVGLNVDEAGNAGLFDSIHGDMTLQHLRLTGAKVRGSAAAALVGTVSGEDNVIQDCRVYLERSDILGKTDETVWISASARAGSLVGDFQFGSLSVSDSFAATVLRGVGSAGGLVGSSGGTLSIESSYADCYLTANATGGLVGTGSGVSLSSCYAAGFQTANSAAGFIDGTLVNAENCYNICALNGKDGAETYSTARAISGSVSNVYYFSGGNAVAGTRSIGEAAMALGDQFRADPGDTVAYNLRGQGLTTYPYPRLKGARHYGDWQADFQTGALVYYEKYDSGKYGFYGANTKTTLSDSGYVVGDGYGVVFRTDTDNAIPEELHIRVEGGEWISLPLTGFAVTEPESGGEFFVVPLPKEIVNAVPKSTSFYKKIEIQAGTGSPLPFYFNPHFANTAVAIQSSEESAPAVEEITIRTARQLYNLSLYHDTHYASLTADSIYRQRRSISYSRYDWLSYSLAGENVTYQQPIGGSIAVPFRAVYDGGNFPISDVSFFSERGEYVGMFGYNTGLLENVVLATNYVPDVTDYFYVKRIQMMEANKPVCMGVLAGCNGPEGTVNNCAVAGYFLSGADGTIHVYENCTLYAGGLVGRNDGLIRASEADCPTMRLSSLFATVNAGGLVGRNSTTGIIENCYALGHAEVADTRGEGVWISGFAGVNFGKVQNSYCAFSLTASGETIAYGFAPKGGLMQNCLYLDNGTYSYAGHLRTYNSVKESIPGVTAVSHKELCDNRGTAHASARNTRFHPNSGSTGVETYPFRAVVRDSAGSYIHYGDWQLAPNLGTLGVFYWEHEEGGANSGYHLTYIGTAEGASDCGTTLCTAHDDGGTITEYGYGYYVQYGQEDDVTLTSVGITVGTAYNTAAAKALRDQISDYVFFPYTTRIATSGDFIRLSNGEKTSGTWTLNYNGHDYTYRITPLFANAISRVGLLADIPLRSSAAVETNYAKTPGSTENNYEIRSAQQLQYINWNYNARNCDTLVTKANQKQFPFLQYATVLTSGRQSKEDATANRPVQYWSQTHDLRGSASFHYTPIAGMATSSSFDASTSPLYAWFGGDYDGQSYKIQDLTVVSDSFTVGLFGVTVGADIRSVILYGSGARDGEGLPLARVVRDTSLIGGQVGATIGAYQVGGLVALAYDYDISNAASVKTVSNCAISGYLIQDSSRNAHGMGYASVGGLIGLSQIKLQRCSAVTTILCDYQSPAGGYSLYGNMVRLGGLAGTALFEVSDCYTGGAIQVSPESLNEKPYGYNADTKTTRLDRAKALHIFVGGISAACYKNAITNFGAVSGASDGELTLNNCYTYMDLPDIKGSVRAVSVIAGTSDRFHRGTKIYTNNCHYLKSVFDGIGYEPPGYFFDLVNINLKLHPEITNRYDTFTLTDEEVEQIKLGNLNSLCKIVINHSATGGVIPGTTDAHQKEESFQALSGEDMVDTLNRGRSGDEAPWDWVTTKEPNGASIDGKYSFSDNPVQEGKNYPFPTVIRQKDLTFSTRDRAVYANVHYGAWYSTGYEWENGRATMDIFADMDTAQLSVPGGPYAEKTFTLSYEKAESYLGDTLVFDPGEEERWEVSRYENDPDNQCFYVTIRALKPGTAVITELQSGASFSLNVTSDLTVSTDETEPNLFHGVEKELSFRVHASQPTALPEDERNDFTAAPLGTWTFTTENEMLLELRESASPNSVLVTGHEPGRRALTAVYSYDYHGTTISETTFVQTKTYGYIGLSDGTTHVSAKRSMTGGVSTGESGTYGTAPDGILGADLFLFATAADGDLDQFTLDRVTVKTAQSESYVVYDRAGGDVDLSRFNVSFFLEEGDALSVETHGAYSYCGASVRYLGEGDSPVITVKVELSDPNGVSRYVFSVTMNSAAKDAVSFASGGGEGSMREIGIVNGSILVPACRFTRTGYTFSTWEYLGESIAPGEVLTGLEGPATLVAQWEPNSYLVHFDAGEGVGEMEDLELHYDEPATLPLCGFTHPAGQNFVSWRAEINGFIHTFSNGESVVNLSTGVTVTLYAVWQTPTLLLSANDGLQQFQPGLGDTVLDGYEEPSRVGWALDGWYTTSSAGGLKVLNADGTVFADVAGITSLGVFAVSQDATLYARWDANSYIVRFDPNGAEGSMGDMTLYYGTPISLSVNSFEHPTGFRFVEWRTEINGVEFSFSDGETVESLTPVQDEVIVLRAIWQRPVTLYLAGGGVTSEYYPANGSNSVSDYSAPTKSGWVLDGWYTAASVSGVKALNADGSVTDNDTDFTSSGRFAMESDVTLYAKWRSTTRFIKVSSLTEDGMYLIASGDSGAVKLMTNVQSVNKSSSYGRLDATAQTVDDETFISFTQPVSDSAVWRIEARSDAEVGRNYAYQRFMLFNCQGLSLRDNGSHSLQMRTEEYGTDNGWWYKGKINNRNLWTYCVDIHGAVRLESEWAHVDAKNHWTLALDGTAWKLNADGNCYLFRAETTFD